MALVKPESQVSGIPNLSLLLPLSWKRRLGESPGRENWEWWVTRIDGNVFIIFIPWFRVSISSFRWFIEVLLCSIFERGNFQFFFKYWFCFMSPDLQNVNFSELYVEKSWPKILYSVFVFTCMEKQQINFPPQKHNIGIESVYYYFTILHPVFYISSICY